MKILISIKSKRYNFYFSDIYKKIRTVIYIICNNILIYLMKIVCCKDKNKMQIEGNLENEEILTSKSNISGYVRNLKCLNRGKYGNVQLGVRHLDNNTVKYYAIKEFMINKKGCYAASYEREKHILQKINNEHINIIKYFNFEETLYTRKIYLEYCDGKDLFDVIKLNKYIIEIDCREIMRQLCMAVKFLHSKNITHRDIKSENIMFVSGNSLRIKLIDFGLSSTDTLMKNKCGTHDYLPPEMILNKFYNNKCDIWSMGVLLYLLITYTFPFDQTYEYSFNINENENDNVNIHIVYHNILYKKIDFFHPTFRGVSYTLIDLIKHMLNRVPQFRYSVDDILNHNWFKINLSV